MHQGVEQTGTARENGHPHEDAVYLCDEYLVVAALQNVLELAAPQEIVLTQDGIKEEAQWDQVTRGGWTDGERGGLRSRNAVPLFRRLRDARTVRRTHD